MPLAGSHRARPSTMRTIKKLAALPLALACVGALCLALANAAPSVPTASADTPQPALGAYDAATTPPTALKASLDGAVKFAMDFQSGASWSTITQSSWPYPQWKGKGFSMIWGIPMLPDTYKPSTNMDDASGSCSGLSQEGDGAFNSEWTQVAHTLINNGFGSSVVRLGWEFNGGWFPWAAGSCPAAFIAAFQQIVTVMRAVSGANFSFEWNPTAGDLDVGNLANYYPGSSFVNYVGLDVYDTAWAYYPGAQSEFDTIQTESYGLNWLSTFAAQEGKAIVLPEWGLGWGVCDAGQPVNAPNNGTCGGDDPTFVGDMASWIKSNNVFEATFWDYGSSSMSGCPNACTPIGRAVGDVNPIPDGNIHSYKDLVAAFGSGSSGTGPTTTTTTTAPPPPPRVGWIVPRFGVAGTTVYFSGSGFTGATAVDFGSTRGTIVSESATSIVATAPPGTATSVVDVKVIGPGGTSIAPDQFNYGPAIKFVSPTSGSQSGGATVTIQGAGFTGATTVSFGGTPTTVISVASNGRTITVTAPEGTAGQTVDVTVSAGGTKTKTNSVDRFTYG